jgi:proline dehydrogenase
VDDLVGAIEEANRDGLSATGNYLGESVHDEPNARRAADIYLSILDRIHDRNLDANISLKFTQLGQDISETFLAKNLGRVLERAKETDTFIRFDMEGSDYTQRTLDAFEKLWSQGWRNIGVVLQSYLKRSAGDVARMNELGARVRLCKGAYAEPESVAFQEREAVDGSFVELMKMLLAHGNYPGIATHDDRMIEATVEFAQEEGIGKDKFEFQMLHGVRRDLQNQLVEDGYNVRAYVPFGEHWYPYLMRRLAERPANMLFFAGSVVKESPLGFLWPSGNGKK